MSTFPTIAEAAKLIAGKSLSPVELTQQCLARIEAIDPTINAFILVTPERALADARAAEARVMSGTAKGILDGIPIAHKDIYNTAGIATTAHSKLLEGFVPDEDAVAVRTLAEAGTVMLGKLSTHEFAMGGPSFDLPWPPARNPWNPEHQPGGSSSGTGAGIAAGLFLGGTGSDTGGSIRSPSALNGVAGIKPTYGLIPRTGIQPLSQSLDHAGPMAWTAEDCALLLQAMAGHDPNDPASVDIAIPDYSATIAGGVKGLRIGVPRAWHESEAPVSPATAKGIADAIDLYRKLGAEIVDITLPPLRAFQAATFVILTSEAFAVHEPWLTTRFNDYGELLRERLALGGFVSGPDYVQALRRRRELCMEMAAAVAGVDVVLTASQPTEAAKITDVPKWRLFGPPGFTNPANLTGYPAMSICSGYGAGGLPVSIQLIGKPFQEAMVFRTAHAYEAAMPWRQSRPAISLGQASLAAQ
jgi:aspartyl-tRNA(Asn)/glutamyl-tRNA(Gln) amidotransferase subunit A